MEIQTLALSKGLKLLNSLSCFGLCKMVLNQAPFSGLEKLGAFILTAKHKIKQHVVLFQTF